MQIAARSCIALLVGIMMSSCSGGIPPEALEFTPHTLAQREAASRYYGTLAEGEMLSASVQVLQDLGFSIDRTAADAGLVTASKQRDATEGGQVAAAIAMAVLFGVYMPVDDSQVIRASIVTRPVEDKGKFTSAWHSSASSPIRKVNNRK